MLLSRAKKSSTNHITASIISCNIPPTLIPAGTSDYQTNRTSKDQGSGIQVTRLSGYHGICAIEISGEGNSRVGHLKTVTSSIQQQRLLNFLVSSLFFVVSQ